MTWNLNRNNYKMFLSCGKWKKKKKGAALIYDKDDVQIRKIATPEAAILYGRNSKWCTAATDNLKIKP